MMLLLMLLYYGATAANAHVDYPEEDHGVSSASNAQVDSSGDQCCQWCYHPQFL